MSTYHGANYGHTVAISDPLGPVMGEIAALIPGEPWPTRSNRSSVQIVKVNTTDGTACSDLNRVETLAIEHMFANCHRMPGKADGFELRRAWARVASACRRGGGNVALAHPATLYELMRRSGPGEFGPIGCWDLPREPQNSHGWRLAMTETATLKVNEIWTKPTVPPGAFIVLYRGRDAFDRPHIAMGHVSRPYHIVNDYGSIKAKDYAAIVEL